MIHLWLWGLPPSSNHAYVTLKTGRRVLSKDGKRYTVETPGLLMRTFREELKIFRKDAPYAVFATFTFFEVENKGWPDQAKNRYKIADASNRFKLFEDALKTAAGIDDSQHLFTAQRKVSGPEERTDAWIWDLEKESCPFDDIAERLLRA